MLYRLRLTRSESELILDYRDPWGDWQRAAIRAFVDEEQAGKEFDCIKTLDAPAYLVLALFREWRCPFPQPLTADGVRLLMDEDDFSEVS